MERHCAPWHDSYYPLASSSSMSDDRPPCNALMVQTNGFLGDIDARARPQKGKSACKWVLQRSWPRKKGTLRLALAGARPRRRSAAGWRRHGPTTTTTTRARTVSSPSPHPLFLLFLPTGFGRASQPPLRPSVVDLSREEASPHEVTHDFGGHQVQRESSLLCIQYSNFPFVR